ncbi:unnamed protein product [Dibothriocephalus latus]|uniref:Uncharacterized protein n=1 Tax=Dibothriocephalus latus TaxID=60516 RepID=A0A3P6T225_DIBLA|nr:unnamed protein product [Dibothriocephalus latus]
MATTIIITSNTFTTEENTPDIPVAITLTTSVPITQNRDSSTICCHCYRTSIICIGLAVIHESIALRGVHHWQDLRHNFRAHTSAIRTSYTHSVITWAWSVIRGVMTALQYRHARKRKAFAHSHFAGGADTSSIITATYLAASSLS